VSRDGYEIMRDDFERNHRLNQTYESLRAFRPKARNNRMVDPLTPDQAEQDATKNRGVAKMLTSISADQKCGPTVHAWGGFHECRA
jgi:hypothetical protein